MQRSRLINQQNLPIPTSPNSKSNFVKNWGRKKRVKEQDDLDELITTVSECLNNSTSILAYDILKKCLMKFKKLKQKQNTDQTSMTESIKLSSISGARKLESLKKSEYLVQQQEQNKIRPLCKEGLSYRIKKPLSKNNDKIKQEDFFNQIISFSEHQTQVRQQQKTNQTVQQSNLNQPNKDQEIQSLKQQIRLLNLRIKSHQNQYIQNPLNIEIQYEVKCQERPQENTQNQRILKLEIERLKDEQRSLWMYLNKTNNK